MKPENLDPREKRIFDKLDLDVRGTGGPSMGDVVFVRSGPGDYQVGLFEGWDTEDDPASTTACVLLPGKIVKAHHNDIIVVRKYYDGR